MHKIRFILSTLAAAGLSLSLLQPAVALEQRDKVYHLVGPYNTAFYDRHNASYRTSAAIHYGHARQHDYLELTPLAEHAERDAVWNEDYLNFLHSRPRIEPTMEYYGPYVSRAMWDLYHAINWTHVHHEQTYDILSESDIPWEDKKHWTDRAVRYYLEMVDVARSPAPLDVTMRRAGVMMKPYFTYFRNYYPLSNNFFYWAHWWHPVIYEAMMIAGNDEEQDHVVQIVNGPVSDEVLKNRPLRMLLSREAMPRYSRLSPESANIFDNLHMLHGIAYDILAYEGWSIEQKREEMYRVIQAMSYQPGDEELARNFSIPHPGMDPRVYAGWMQGTDGEMNRIMQEMMQEMMPMMAPDGLSEDEHNRLMDQFRKKLKPGMQPGEHAGSLGEALKAEVPHLKMTPESMNPGTTPQKMVDAMLQGWREKQKNASPVEPITMEQDPRLQPVRSGR